MNKNTYDDFKGVQLSTKYDFDPDKHKYAQEPPKAGAGKNTKKDEGTAKKTDGQKSPNPKLNNGQDQEAESESEEIDVNEVKKKVLKQGRNEDDDDEDDDIVSNPSDVEDGRRVKPKGPGESEKTVKLP